MARKLGALLHHLDGGIDSPAIGMAEHHKADRMYPKTASAQGSIGLQIRLSRCPGYSAIYCEVAILTTIRVSSLRLSVICGGLGPMILRGQLFFYQRHRWQAK